MRLLTSFLDLLQGWFNWRRLLPPLLILIIGTLLASAIQWRKATSQTTVTAEPLPVTVVRATEIPHYTITRAFTGRLVPRRASEVGFELGGRIAHLAVDDGNRVKAGQLMAHLDTEQLVIQKAQLQAQLREVTARLELAQVRLKRQRRLQASGHASQDNIDEIRFEKAALDAQRDSIKANLQSVNTDLKDAVLRAPFDAVIVQRLVDEGNVVDTGAPIFRLHETGHPEARIGIPIDYAQQLQIGDQHDLQLGQSTVIGTVTALIPDVDTATRTITTVFTLDQDDGAAIANALVRLNLTDEIPQAGFWLPTTALSEGRRGLWTVYVVNQKTLSSTAVHQQQVLRKSVEVLHTETDRVFVQGTLLHNDPVVTTGTQRLAPGQLVQIIKRSQEAAEQPVALAD
jgi:RND family efflux transporter MFP subunit